MRILIKITEYSIEPNCEQTLYINPDDISRLRARNHDGKNLTEIFMTNGQRICIEGAVSDVLKALRSLTNIYVIEEFAP